AGIILLLVSADFLATRYIRDKEIARAMERHEAGTARVIPVLLKPVDAWRTASFGKLQAVPENGKAVTTWKNRDEAFADIARRIREAAVGRATGDQKSSGRPRGKKARPSAGHETSTDRLGRLALVPVLPPHLLPRQAEVDACCEKLVGTSRGTVAI